MRSWHRLLRVVLSLVSIALPATPASALDWIVVPYGLSPPAGAIRAADRLVHALAERRTPVASQHELKDLFLKRSRSQLSADPRLSKSVADARKHALEHAAYGRREAARRAAEEAMSVTESAPEALTDTDVARHVLDACLAVVRVDLQERDRPLAVQDAQRCRRLVPDLAVYAWRGAPDSPTGQYAYTTEPIDAVVVAGGGAGSPTACAVVRDGTVRCWGINSEGQLGDGTDVSPEIDMTTKIYKVTTVKDLDLW